MASSSLVEVLREVPLLRRDLVSISPRVAYPGASIPVSAVETKSIEVKRVYDIKQVSLDIETLEVGREFNIRMNKMREELWAKQITATSAWESKSSKFSISSMKRMMRMLEGRPTGEERPSFLRDPRGAITELRAPKAWLQEAKRAMERGDRRLVAMPPWFQPQKDDLQPIELQIIHRSGRHLRVPAMLQFTRESDLNRYGAWFHHVGGKVD